MKQTSSNVPTSVNPGNASSFGCVTSSQTSSVYHSDGQVLEKCEASKTTDRNFPSALENTSLVTCMRHVSDSATADMELTNAASSVANLRSVDCNVPADMEITNAASIVANLRPVDYNVPADMELTNAASSVANLRSVDYDVPSDMELTNAASSVANLRHVDYNVPADMELTNAASSVANLRSVDCNVPADMEITNAASSVANLRAMDYNVPADMELTNAASNLRHVDYNEPADMELTNAASSVANLRSVDCNVPADMEVTNAASSIDKLRAMDYNVPADMEFTNAASSVTNLRHVDYNVPADMEITNAASSVTNLRPADYNVPAYMELTNPASCVTNLRPMDYNVPADMEITNAASTFSNMIPVESNSSDDKEISSASCNVVLKTMDRSESAGIESTNAAFGVANVRSFVSSAPVDMAVSNASSRVANLMSTESNSRVDMELTNAAGTAHWRSLESYAPSDMELTYTTSKITHFRLLENNSSHCMEMTSAAGRVSDLRSMEISAQSGMRLSTGVGTVANSISKKSKVQSDMELSNVRSVPDSKTVESNTSTIESTPATCTVGTSKTIETGKSINAVTSYKEVMIDEKVLINSESASILRTSATNTNNSLSTCSNMFSASATGNASNLMYSEKEESGTMESIDSSSKSSISDMTLIDNGTTSKSFSSVSLSTIEMAKTNIPDYSVGNASKLHGLQCKVSVKLDADPVNSSVNAYSSSNDTAQHTSSISTQNDASCGVNSITPHEQILGSDNSLPISIPNQSYTKVDSSPRRVDSSSAGVETPILQCSGASAQDTNAVLKGSMNLKEKTIVVPLNDSPDLGTSCLNSCPNDFTAPNINISDKNPGEECEISVDIGDRILSDHSIKKSFLSENNEQSVSNISLNHDSHPKTLNCSSLDRFKKTQMDFSCDSLHSVGRKRSDSRESDGPQRKVLILSHPECGVENSIATAKETVYDNIVRCESRKQHLLNADSQSTIKEVTIKKEQLDESEFLCNVTVALVDSDESVTESHAEEVIPSDHTASTMSVSEPVSSEAQLGQSYEDSSQTTLIKPSSSGRNAVLINKTNLLISESRKIATQAKMLCDKVDEYLNRQAMEKRDQANNLQSQKVNQQLSKLPDSNPKISSLKAPSKFTGMEKVSNGCSLCSLQESAQIFTKRWVNNLMLLLITLIH